MDKTVIYGLICSVAILQCLQPVHMQTVAAISEDSLRDLLTKTTVLVGEATKLISGISEFKAKTQELEDENEKLKREITHVKKMLTNHIIAARENEEELRNEYHNSRMYVVKKQHAMEEKMSWLLEQGPGRKSISAQEIVALQQLRSQDDYRPISSITAQLTMLVYTSCEDVQSQRGSFPGIYTLHYGSGQMTDVYCNFINGKVISDFRPRSNMESNVYRDCEEAYSRGMRTSGIYKLWILNTTTTDAYCEQEAAGGGWTVIQQRNNGGVDFYKNWADYKRGFGDAAFSPSPTTSRVSEPTPSPVAPYGGDYWLGNDAIHALTADRNKTLRVEATERSSGKQGSADYSSFWVDDETAQYTLRVSGYTGYVLGNVLTYHNGQKFSSHDSDNDENSSNCAYQAHAGWWFKSCYEANINGAFSDVKSWKGIKVKHWATVSHPWVYLSSTRMMVRSRH